MMRTQSAFLSSILLDGKTLTNCHSFAVVFHEVRMYVERGRRDLAII